jgi:hypothetical protein
MLLAALCVAGWWCARRGHDWAAGAALGAALSMKLFPAMPIFFFVLERRIKVVISAAAVYLGVAAVMTSRLGVDAWRDYFSVEGGVVDRWLGDPHNASIAAALQHLIRPACGAPLPLPASRLATVGGALIGAAIFFGLYALWRRSSRDARSFDLALLAIVALSAFANPFAFEHYYSLLVPAMFIVLCELTVDGTALGLRVRIGSLATLSLAFAAMAVPWGVVEHSWQWAVANPTRLHRLHLWEAARWLPYALVLGWSALLLRARSNRSSAEMSTTAVAATSA